MAPKAIVSIIIFPGSNCDRDLKVAIQNCLNIKPKIVWHKESSINNTSMILIPGGFSFGDYLRAGILATKSPAIKELIRWSKKGVPIVGICNGFQILTECKLLPGTLIKNSDPKFLCTNVNLKINNNNAFSKLFKKNQVIKLPIAHSQGNYYIKNDGLKSLEDNNQIVMQYSNTNGLVNKKSNPNGSIKNIAGITNSKKTIIGMMPHPERAIDNKKMNDGTLFFENLGKLL